jgi:hypothetical protein
MLAVRLSLSFYCKFSTCITKYDRVYSDIFEICENQMQQIHVINWFIKHGENEIVERW